MRFGRQRLLHCDPHVVWSIEPVVRAWRADRDPSVRANQTIAAPPRVFGLGIAFQVSIALKLGEGRASAVSLTLPGQRCLADGVCVTKRYQVLIALRPRADQPKHRAGGHGERRGPQPNFDQCDASLRSATLGDSSAHAGRFKQLACQLTATVPWRDR